MQVGAGGGGGWLRGTKDIELYAAYYCNSRLILFSPFDIASVEIFGVKFLIDIRRNVWLCSLR